MKTNPEYVAKALVAVSSYVQAQNAPQYAKGEYCRFKLEDSDLTDTIASILHLAEELRNEGQDIDPRLVWERAWCHFDAEVLDPDDIEQNQREVAEERDNGS